MGGAYHFHSFHTPVHFVAFCLDQGGLCCVGVSVLVGSVPRKREKRRSKVQIYI